MVEQLTLNQRVVGSNPTRPTTQPQKALQHAGPSLGHYLIHWRALQGQDPEPHAPSYDDGDSAFDLGNSKLRREFDDYYALSANPTVEDIVLSSGRQPGDSRAGAFVFQVARRHSMAARGSQLDCNRE